MPAGTELEAPGADEEPPAGVGIGASGIGMEDTPDPGTELDAPAAFDELAPIGLPSVEEVPAGPEVDEPATDGAPLPEAGMEDAPLPGAEVDAPEPGEDEPPAGTG